MQDSREWIHDPPRPCVFVDARRLDARRFFHRRSAIGLGACVETETSRGHSVGSTDSRPLVADLGVNSANTNFNKAHVESYFWHDVGETSDSIVKDVASGGGIGDGVAIGIYMRHL